MNQGRADIIKQLKKDLLPLQGFTYAGKSPAVDATLGPIKYSFPNSSFPLAAVHEFISMGSESMAATGGFISTIIASLMKTGGASLWISPVRNIFPPALKTFGIAPDRIIFIELKKEKQMAWAMEEALKCKGLSAVICEMQELSFTTSRRLQLAVEQSKVTGFVLRNFPKNIQASACVTRWQINSIPSAGLNGMPGLGSPRWDVKLLKVRNGSPASWQVEFVGGRLLKVAAPGNADWGTQKQAV